MNFINLMLIRLKLIINKSLLFAMLIIPIASFLMLRNINLEKEMKVNIGIVFEDEYTKKEYEKIIKDYFTDTLNFIEYENENALIESVNLYNVDCGYVFLQKDNYKESIKLYKTPTTTADKITNLFLSTILIQNRSGELGYDALHPYINNIDESIIKEEILNKSYAYVKDGAMIHVDYSNSYNQNYYYKTSSEKILFTIIGSMVIFFSILTSETIIKERKSEVLNRIKLLDNNFESYYKTYFASLFLINFVYLSLSTVMIKVLHRNINNISRIFFANIIFSFIVSLASVFIWKKIKSNKYILSSGIFIFLFSIIFSESIFLVKDIIKTLEPLKYLNIIFYYLKIINI